MSRRYFFIQALVFALALVFVLPNDAVARGVPSGSKAKVVSPTEFPSTLDVLKEFNEDVPKMLERTVNSESYKSVYHNLYLVFGLIFLVTSLAKYMLNALNEYEVWASVVFAAMVGSSPLWFLQFIYAALSFSQGVGDAAQTGVLGNSSPYYPVEFMFNVIGHQKIGMDWNMLWNPAARVAFLVEVIVLIFLSGLLVLLAMAAVIGALVQSYVFIPLALTGLIAIPFGLVPIFGFLLDGWVRLFFTVIFFGIFVKITVSVAVFGLGLMFGVSDLSDFEGRIFEFNLDNIHRLLGAASLALLALWTVLNSYSFASGIVSGMGSGIFGGAGAVTQLGKALSRKQ